ncbi:MAG: AAA family ATPase [Deltaproteobacteria bacterium]|nr:AAA family ATPase [Deltaproteobacteria bacterium]MBW1873678.1 AAA family ATPase [Deltaproteobacteria bacterium]
MKHKPIILVTGAPGVGKTTLVKNVAERIKGVNVAGFITVEQRGEKGRSRIVFVNLDGSKEVEFAVTGKVKGKKGRRVGKYNVDIDVFEEAALEAIAFQAEYDLYIIDEIGPMEVMSKMFCETAKMLLKNEKVAVLATVAKAGHGFIREVKRLPGIETIEITAENKNRIEDELIMKFMEALIKPESEEQK